ncbi:Hypothetical predicted protein, partial [Pelobates cultripes]
MADRPDSTTRGLKMIYPEATGPINKATDTIEEIFNRFCAKLSHRAKQTASLQEVTTGERKSDRKRPGKPLKGGK